MHPTCSVALIRLCMCAEARSFAEVAAGALSCRKLDSKVDKDPSGRMAEDAYRVGVATLARQRDAPSGR